MNTVSSLLKFIANKALKIERRNVSTPYFGAFSIVKCGNVVSITGNNATEVPNGQFLTLDTLPTGWRPETSTMIVFRPPANDAVGNFRLNVVPTNGNVQLYYYGSAQSPASTNASFSLSYIATR